MTAAIRILPGMADGPVLAINPGLSFWGGVDPATARVIDAHHPACGADLAGRIVLMPTSRGSCSGSGVILDLMLNERAPAALIFSEAEDIATLGALIGAEMFGKSLPILRVSATDMERLSQARHLRIAADEISGDDLRLPIAPAPALPLHLDADERAMLEGRDGAATALAMRILCAMAHQQGAERLIAVRRGHIDGCILAHPANLIFAERMEALGARVRIPTTINAISVDRENWQDQGVPRDFGTRAARLADAYARMGCTPSFTCAPYLLEDHPLAGEDIAWAESNAVVFANSVLGARSPKHPDYLDLCMAITGRAPLAGVYRDSERRARRILEFDLPADADDAIWPLIGYLAGQAAPDRIPLLRVLAGMVPGRDDLKALCAAFGTTSAAPMLHIEGVTPEASTPPHADADLIRIGRAELAGAWRELNSGPDAIGLVAIGSPHASLGEIARLAEAMQGLRARIPVIVTAGRASIADARDKGLLARLDASGVQVIPDLCWCSITEPVLPPATRTIMTNSGKYAHYGPGLSGRALRFGSLGDCVETALSGQAPAGPPHWLS